MHRLAHRLAHRSVAAALIAMIEALNLVHFALHGTPLDRGMLDPMIEQLNVTALALGSR